MPRRSNILILSYYWPPAGGAGVQRWLKMLKYWDYSKYNVTVYTAEHGDGVVEDSSLQAEVPDALNVVRRPIWEPYVAYNRFLGRKPGEKVYSAFIEEGKTGGWAQRFSIWLRSNLFIPDARAFWIRPSIRYLKPKLAEWKIDTIISTGPPHSMHLIAQGLLKARPEIFWVADFRDPWTHIDFYRQLRLTKWADRRHHTLERRVLTGAHRVLTVSPTLQGELSELGEGRSVELIFNGYDPADFTAVGQDPHPAFTLMHVGSMNPDRNPTALWQALRQACDANPDLDQALEIHLIGVVDRTIKESIAEAGLAHQVRYEAFRPHREVIGEMQRAWMLLLPINDTPNAMGILPGKMYEYMGAGRPVLLVGPNEADSRKITDGWSQVQGCDYADVTGMRRAIERQFKAYQGGKFALESSEEHEVFSRERIAQELMESLPEWRRAFKSAAKRSKNRSTKS
jgi:hypothetical protein